MLEAPCSKVILCFLLAGMCLAQTPVQTSSAKWGTVEGVVLDDVGKPLPDATVTAYMDAQGASRDVMQYKANDKGEFSLHLPEGRVWLSADKRSDGYPYAFFAFYSMPGQVFPTVHVEPGATTQGIVIHVGEKAAHLIYNVVDKDGKPVLGRFIFVRPDQADRPFSTSALAVDDLLVPTAPFRLTLEAKGYRTWHYGGDKWQSEEGLISLRSGQTVKLAIQLQRDSTGS